jgi:hypothetical protein
VACDPHDRAARALARGLGTGFVTPHVVVPAPNAQILAAPHVVWLDGEAERFERDVTDRARDAILRLLARLHVARRGPRAAPPSLRVVISQVETLEAEPGLVEAVVSPGGVVHAGEVAAWVGEPGQRLRRAVRASTSGVVLWARAGLHQGGRVMGIGRLQRSLSRVSASHKTRGQAPLDIGWCERVDLPELGVRRLPAKIDTGARTSALHVASMKAVGNAQLDVEVPTGRGGRTRRVRVRVVEHTRVRDSSGSASRRPVIETLIKLGTHEVRARLSLTDRGDMTFPMLVGRTALDGVRVHPTKRFLLD